MGRLKAGTVRATLRCYNTGLSGGISVGWSRPRAKRGPCGRPRRECARPAVAPPSRRSFSSGRAAAAARSNDAAP